LEQNGKTTGVQVIARATDVLRALEAEPGGLSLAKIARRVELPRPGLAQRRLPSGA
jgi:DNA-binding IclR family transcriptional regulator